MSATPKDRAQLDILDRVAVLIDIDEDLQCVITRIANRAKTDEEGDDVRKLIHCRSRLVDYRTLEAAQHRSRRGDAQ